MKRLCLILIILLLITTISCKKKDPYTFASKEDITSLFTTYQISLSLYDISIELIENKDYALISVIDNLYLINKSNNTTYSINTFDKSKKLLDKTIDYSNTKTIILDFVTSYLTIDKSKYEKCDISLSLVNLSPIYLLSKSTSNELAMYSEELYISNEYNLLLKKVITTEVNNSRSTTVNEVKSLSFDSSYVNSLINDYLNYHDTQGPKHYEFLSNEEILSSINNLSVKYNSDSSEEFELSFNDDYIYLSENDNSYIYIKNTNCTYQISGNFTSKKLQNTSTSSLLSKYQKVLDMITSYLSINNGDFTKETKKVTLSNHLCSVYHEREYDTSLYSQTKYYISDEYQICIKYEHTNIIDNKEEYSYILLNDLVINQDSINKLLFTYASLENVNFLGY